MTRKRGKRVTRTPWLDKKDELACFMCFRRLPVSELRYVRMEDTEQMAFYGLCEECAANKNES